MNVKPRYIVVAVVLAIGLLISLIPSNTPSEKLQQKAESGVPQLTHEIRPQGTEVSKIILEEGDGDWFDFVADVTKDGGKVGTITGRCRLAESETNSTFQLTNAVYRDVASGAVATKDSPITQPVVAWPEGTPNPWIVLNPPGLVTKEQSPSASEQYGYVLSMEPHGEFGIDSFCFPASGNRLLTLGHDTTVAMWSLPDGHLIRRILPNGFGVQHTVSDDGARILFVENVKIDAKVFHYEVWEIETGKLLASSRAANTSEGPTIQKNRLAAFMEMVSQREADGVPSTSFTPASANKQRSWRSPPFSKDRSALRLFAWTEVYLIKKDLNPEVRPKPGYYVIKEYLIMGQNGGEAANLDFDLNTGRLVDSRKRVRIPHSDFLRMDVANDPWDRVGPNRRSTMFRMTGSKNRNESVSWANADGKRVSIMKDAWKLGHGEPRSLSNGQMFFWLRKSRQAEVWALKDGRPQRLWRYDKPATTSSKDSLRFIAIQADPSSRYVGGITPSNRKLHIWQLPKNVGVDAYKNSPLPSESMATEVAGLGYPNSTISSLSCVFGLDSKHLLTHSFDMRSIIDMKLLDAELQRKAEPFPVLGLDDEPYVRHYHVNRQSRSSSNIRSKGKAYSHPSRWEVGKTSSGSREIFRIDDASLSQSALPTELLQRIGQDATSGDDGKSYVAKKGADNHRQKSLIFYRDAPRPPMNPNDWEYLRKLGRTTSFPLEGVRVERHVSFGGIGPPSDGFATDGKTLPNYVELRLSNAAMRFGNIHVDAAGKLALFSLTNTGTENRTGLFLWRLAPAFRSEPTKLASLANSLEFATLAPGGNTFAWLERGRSNPSSGIASGKVIVMSGLKQPTPPRRVEVSPKPRARIVAMQITPSGKHLLIANTFENEKTEITAWDVDKGRDLGVIARLPHPLDEIQLSRDGKWMLTLAGTVGVGGDTGYLPLRLWKLQSPLNVPYLAPNPVASQTPDPSATAEPPTSPPTDTNTSVSPKKPAESPKAKRLFELAKLFLANGQTKLAHEKLQQLVDQYPESSFAKTAKELLPCND